MRTTTAWEEATSSPFEQAVAVDAFLRDPIGYGHYNFADPITLEEFSSVANSHGNFVSIVA